MNLTQDAEFVDALFRNMKQLIAQWRNDLTSLQARILKAIQRENLYL